MLEIRTQLVTTHEQYSPEPSAGAAQRPWGQGNGSALSWQGDRGSERQSACRHEAQLCLGACRGSTARACHHLGGPGAQGWVCWLATQGLAPVGPEKVRVLSQLHLGRVWNRLPARSRLSLAYCGGRGRGDRSTQVEV